jgi:hypothetical protein
MEKLEPLIISFSDRPRNWLQEDPEEQAYYYVTPGILVQHKENYYLLAHSLVINGERIYVAYQKNGRIFLAKTQIYFCYAHYRVVILKVTRGLKNYVKVYNIDGQIIPNRNEKYYYWASYLSPQVLREHGINCPENIIVPGNVRQQINLEFKDVLAVVDPVSQISHYYYKFIIKKTDYQHFSDLINSLDEERSYGFIYNAQNVIALIVQINKRTILAYPIILWFKLLGEYKEYRYNPNEYHGHIVLPFKFQVRKGKTMISQGQIISVGDRQIETRRFKKNYPCILDPMFQDYIPMDLYICLNIQGHGQLDIEVLDKQGERNTIKCSGKLLEKHIYPLTLHPYFFQKNDRSGIVYHNIAGFILTQGYFYLFQFYKIPAHLDPCTYREEIYLLDCIDAVSRKILEEHFRMPRPQDKWCWTPLLVTQINGDPVQKFSDLKQIQQITSIRLGPTLEKQIKIHF